MKLYLRRAHVAEIEPLTKSSSLRGTRFGSYILGCSKGLEAELRVGAFTTGLLADIGLRMDSDFDCNSAMTRAYWNDATDNPQMSLSIESAICLVDHRSPNAPPFKIGKMIYDELCAGGDYYEKTFPKETIIFDNLLNGNPIEIAYKRASP